MQQKSKQYVLIRSFSIKEIFAFVAVFVGIAIFLFPKSELERRIFQEENTNLDLSITYLQNLLKVYKTPEIFEGLVKRYSMKGDYLKAYKVISESKKFFSQDNAILLKAEYNILKSIYFSEQNQKNELIEKMETILKNLVSTTKDDKVLLWAIKEGETLGRYMLVKYLIEKYMYLCMSNIECDLFILRSAIATGDSGFAAHIAMKIAKKRGIINGNSNFQSNF